MLAAFHLNFPKHFEILNEINFSASPEAGGENKTEEGGEIIFSAYPTNGDMISSYQDGTWHGNLGCVCLRLT